MCAVHKAVGYWEFGSIFSADGGWEGTTLVQQWQWRPECPSVQRHSVLAPHSGFQQENCYELLRGKVMVINGEQMQLSKCDFHGS